MARRNPNYYRGQYSPEAIYQQEDTQPGIISMYNPEAQAQLLDAVSQRQQRFDATKTALAAEKARIGETETYDLADLSNRLKAFESSINEVVKSKYNGDYGAAANEVANMIGTERSNPFYHFNKQKVEMSKAYLDTKMKLGANFMSAGNPLEVSFDDWQNGKTFEFTPVNRNDIVENSAAVFGTIANTLMNTPEPQLTKDQRFLKVVMQRGMSNPEEVKDFITKDPTGVSMVEEVINSMPELAGLEDKEAVMDAITQGAYKSIGRTEVDFMNNPDYIDANTRASASKKDKSYFSVMTPVGFIDPGKYYSESKKGDKELVGLKTFNINSLSPNVMSTSETNELNTLKETLANEIKILAFTDTPDANVSYLKKGKKNIENMDRTKPINITDVAFSDTSAEIVLGLQGFNAEGKALEAGLVLDAGDESKINNRILRIIPFLDKLGDPYSEFNNELNKWLIRNYPQSFKNQVQ